MTEKHPIEDYLSYKGARLPAHGSGWRKMRCPFHGDKNASAAVNYDANRFKCHGCGVSGDIYDLIIHDRGGTFNEAVEFAQTISTKGDSAVFHTPRQSKGLSSDTTSVGRRSSHISFGSGRRPTSGS